MGLSETEARGVGVGRVLREGCLGGLIARKGLRR